MCINEHCFIRLVLGHRRLAATCETGTDMTEQIPAHEYTPDPVRCLGCGSTDPSAAQHLPPADCGHKLTRNQAFQLLRFMMVLYSTITFIGGIMLGWLVNEAY